MTALVAMNLTHTEPTDRLEEICNILGATCNFETVYLENGIFISVHLLSHEGVTYDIASTFVEGACLKHAKCVVSAVLIDRLNLGIDDAEPEIDDEEEDNALAEIADRGMSLVTDLMRDAISTLKGDLSDEEN